MPNRWYILFVLFFCRTAMAFQFQSVAALSPLLIEGYAVSLIDIGLLIGLYLGPGIIIAIVGGGVAAKVGDRRIVGLSLLVMFAGLLIMALGDCWGWLVAGRVLAGIGGVIVNVVMTKMLIDWFSGREIATAMGVFVTSWPFGIALALIVLPGLAASGGLLLAWGAVGILIALAWGLFVYIYRPAGLETAAVSSDPAIKLALGPLALAAGIWGLYNAAFALVFGFGPLLLIQQGMTTTAASSMISLFTLLVGVGIPLGGVIADRSGRKDALVLGSFVLSATLLLVILAVDLWQVHLFYGAMGLVLGLAGGPILTLPGEILKPDQRAVGMGFFWAIYYACMMVGPALGGALADQAGRADIAYVLGAWRLLVSALGLVALRRVARRAAV